MITKAPRGTADWYGIQMQKREKIEEICKDEASRFNIRQIQTPVFEHTQLFNRSVGETTDVVQKEMYTFEDRGGRSITLKPEGTAGVIRAYLEHGMFEEAGLTKLYYITPAFRYEKPQSGRLRQHHQFGVEMIGSESPLVEAELITLITNITKRLGLKDIEVHINSIGCPECRARYNEALLEYLKKYENDLCDTCKERMGRNPLRVIDCKNPGCKEIVKDAPKTVDYLCTECRSHFESLQDLLGSLDIKYSIDTGIVRGLDYYTRTVFEFVNKDGFTLCGGGRYDGLVKQIDEKQDIPAAGFGMGIERLIYFLDLEGNELVTPKVPDIYVGILGNVTAQAYKIVMDLRNRGLTAETDYFGKSLKAQMKYANKCKARFCVIIGEEEIKNGRVRVKNMLEGGETECEISQIADIVK